MNLLITTIETVALFIIEKLFKIKLKKENRDTLIQFIRFGSIGLTNTLISYVLYSCSLLTMQSMNLFINVDYLIAQLIAFILSVLWSFYWNSKMVFVNQSVNSKDLLKSLIKTYISYSFTGLFLNSILLILWVDILNISEFIAPLINLIISVPLNFIINKFWAFNNTK